jgi:trehalose 6-phosphate synthase
LGTAAATPTARPSTATTGCGCRPGEESYAIRRVWLSPEEENGLLLRVLERRPLAALPRGAHPPGVRSADWAHYQAVNRRFADAVCEEVDSDDPIVLVQDYHFALAPSR